MSQSRLTPIRVRYPRTGLVGLAIGVVVVAGACTSAAATPAGSRAPSAASSTAAMPAASLNLSAEVDATVAGLEDALAKYRAGDSQGALDAIAETYEEHFELIEDPLGDVDHDFMENLEELIAVKARAVIHAAKPVTELEVLVTEATTLLARAKDVLS